MKKGIYLFLLILFGIKCNAQKSNNSIFNSKYCFKKGDHELTVIFKTKRDTVFLYYYNIVANGNFLNGFDEQDDYAGSFVINNFRNNQVDFQIKSYRDVDEKYLLNISINQGNGWIYWNINQKSPVGYLPKHATLKKCD